jgi:hypothetical protein
MTRHFGSVLKWWLCCATGQPCWPVTREWRNWQTRTVEGRVSSQTWGFKSPLAHHRDTGQLALEDQETARDVPSRAVSFAALRYTPMTRPSPSPF